MKLLFDNKQRNGCNILSVAANSSARQKQEMDLKKISKKEITHTKNIHQERRLIKILARVALFSLYLKRETERTSTRNAVCASLHPESRQEPK
jgi:uncharacterized membrane protein affecting hemolysin expression